MNETSWLGRNWYRAGGAVFGGMAFLVGWIYAIASYGFFIGVALGWIPAGIVAVLVGFLWPVLLSLLVLAMLAVLVFSEDGKRWLRSWPLWANALVLLPLVLFAVYQWATDIRDWWVARSQSKISQRGPS